MRKKRSRKQILFVVGVIIVLVVLAIIASSIFTKKNLDNLKGALSDLNPFTPRANETEVNKSLNKTLGGGGITPTVETTEAEEVTYGSGKLRIVNWLSDSEFGKGYHTTFHWFGGTDGFDYYDSHYSTLFSPSGKKTKIISRITGYELRVDTRAINSLSTIYLELSLHSQDGGAITIDSTNELRLSFPLANSGYNFSGKTLTIQQYNPSNASASYPAYDVRDVIDNDGGVIVLARLDGSYESEVPYAYFRVGFS